MQDNLKQGEPCQHPGCLHHVTHPCEGCGRVAGVQKLTGAQYGLLQTIKAHQEDDGWMLASDMGEHQSRVRIALVDLGLVETHTVAGLSEYKAVRPTKENQ